jgi:hypothetical protein
MTRTRGAIRVSTIAKSSGEIKGDSIQKSYCAAERLNIREFPACQIASARLVTQK